MEKKKNEVPNISWKDLGRTLFIFALVKCTPFFTFLTKYPPFNMFPDNYVFHYNNIKLIRIKDSINEHFNVLSEAFDRDTYFHYLYYLNNALTLDKVKNFLKDTDAIVNQEGKYIKIIIPRD